MNCHSGSARFSVKNLNKINLYQKIIENSPKHKAICHSVEVAKQESRDALQRDKRNSKIGLNFNNVWYKVAK